MNNVSKVKIAVGYTLLLAVLFFSLFFVHREMENLILTDDLYGYKEFSMTMTEFLYNLLSNKIG